MTTKRIKQYYAIITSEDGDTRDGMLFTSKELKRMPFFEKRDLLSGVKLVRVKVYNTDAYYSFGRRFASAIKEYIAEK